MPHACLPRSIPRWDYRALSTGSEQFSGAERDDDGEVRVLAGDAIARHHAAKNQWQEAERWLARADRWYPSAAHLLVERDRFDAEQVRVARSRRVLDPPVR